MSGVMALSILVLIVAIFVALSRWVFRINDIVDRLDGITIKIEKVAKILEQKG